jgi:hypothetical protein
MCVCFIATLESLQHVLAYMGHLQVIHSFIYCTLQKSIYIDIVSHMIKS